MAEKGVLDLRRIDVLSSRDDHVLLPVHDVEVPVFVHRRDVPGMEPSVLQRLSRVLGPVPVALHGIRPAQQDLALFSRLDVSVLIVDDAHGSMEERLATGAGPRARVLGTENAAGVVLGQPVELADLDSGRCVFLDQADRYRRCVDQDDVDRAPVVFLEVGHQLEEIQERGHGTEPTDLLFAQKLQEALGIEAPEQNRLRALIDEPGGTSQTTDMKEGKRHERRIADLHSKGRHQIHRAPEVVRMRELGTLRSARRPRGVQNGQSVIVTPHDHRLLVGGTTDHGLVTGRPLRHLVGDGDELLG